MGYDEFEAPYYFKNDLPPVPIEPKFLRIDVKNPSKSKKRTINFPLMNGINGRLNIDFIFPEVYTNNLSSQEISTHVKGDPLRELILSQKDAQLELKRQGSMTRRERLGNQTSNYLRKMMILTENTKDVLYGKNIHEDVL